MSAVDETVRRETERGSSVTLALNAKRDTQITVKAYADEEPGALALVSREAQQIYDTLVEKYVRGGS